MLLFAEAAEAGSPAGRRREPKRGDPSPPRLHPPSCSGGVLRTTAKGIAGVRGVRELRPALSRQRLRRAFVRRGSHTVTPPPRRIPVALPAAQFLPPGHEPGPATRPGLLRPLRRDESAPGWDRIRIGRVLRKLESLKKKSSAALSLATSSREGLFV